MAGPTLRRIPADEIRRRFNDAQLWERAERGSLGKRIVKESHPAPPPAGEPACTRSQLLEIFDPATGSTIAKAHCYRRPDGSIGASGRPDPKWLRCGDTIYAPDNPVRGTTGEPVHSVAATVRLASGERVAVGGGPETTPSVVRAEWHAPTVYWVFWPIASVVFAAAGIQRLLTEQLLSGLGALVLGVVLLVPAWRQITAGLVVGDVLRIVDAPWRTFEVPWEEVAVIHLNLRGRRGSSIIEVERRDGGEVWSRYAVAGIDRRRGEDVIAALQARAQRHGFRLLID